VTFSGAITDSGQGIALANNSGAILSFSGGITLNGANSRFAANGGGTLNVTGTNTIGSTTPAAGNALAILNTTIGASGVTFRSIASDGGAKGISLSGTGSGAFTVSGTGAAGSGGTIRNASNRGGEFILAASVTLNHMVFDNNGSGNTGAGCGNAVGATTSGGLVTDAACISNIHLQSVTTAVLNAVTATDSEGHGINGYQVGGLTLNGVSIERNGDDAGEDGVQLVNATGTVTVSGVSTFRDNASNQFEAQSASGSSTFNIAGAFFGLTNFPSNVPGSPPSPGTNMAGSGLLISGSGAANITVSVTGSNRSDSTGSAAMNITLGTAASGNTFGSNGAPIAIANASTGSMTYVIRNNTITNDTAITGNDAATAITAARSGAGSVMRGTIDDNTIGTPGTGSSGCAVFGCDGIALPDSATSSANVYHVTVTNNQISHVYGGITSDIGGAANGLPRTSLVITGNVIQNPPGITLRNAIQVDSGTQGTSKPQTCVEISGNTMAGAWGFVINNDSLRLRHRGSDAAPNPAAFRVRNWDGLNGAAPGLESFLEGANTFGAGTVDPFGFQLTGSNVFTGGAAACVQ
jgi:hypothetical protein